MNTMQAEVAAWENDRNNRTKKIDLRFTASDARIKFKRLYLQPKLLHGTMVKFTLFCLDPAPEKVSHGNRNFGLRGNSKGQVWISYHVEFVYFLSSPSLGTEG